MRSHTVDAIGRNRERCGSSQTKGRKHLVDEAAVCIQRAGKALECSDDGGMVGVVAFVSDG
ncbi:hypothetical protein ACN9MI_25595 (plasmid) [Rhodococcoides fascians]|uniref:hypothetical protein n=1 Tax=Rhodococcoides fascians TaxID=1828 RepID=UPI003CF4A413